jgi:hypothetical protein
MSEENDFLLHPAILTMLGEMEAVFKLHNIDYYFAGAFARDIHYKSHGSDNLEKLKMQTGRLNLPNPRPLHCKCRDF